MIFSCLLTFLHNGSAYIAYSSSYLNVVPSGKDRDTTRATQTMPEKSTASDSTFFQEKRITLFGNTFSQHLLNSLYDFHVLMLHKQCIWSWGKAAREGKTTWRGCHSHTYKTVMQGIRNGNL